MPAIKLSWPREGSVFFLDIQPFYEKLKMTGYDGLGSKWCYDCIPGWTKALAAYNMGGQILKSNVSTKREEVLSRVDRFLPRPAFSVRAGLCLLWRWSKDSVQHGGIRHGVARNLALNYAINMTQDICNRPPELPVFKLTIEFTEDWTDSHPRPHVPVHPMTFEVSDDGYCTMDLSEWAGQVLNNELANDCPKVVWWKAVKNLMGDDHVVSLIDVLQGKAMVEKEHKVFISQLLFQLSMRAEYVLRASLGGTGSSWAVRADVVDQDPARDIRKMDLRLALHVAAAKVATEGHQHFSISHDKAFVKGLSLQNAAFVLPTNMGAVMIPAVLWR